MITTINEWRRINEENQQSDMLVEIDLSDLSDTGETGDGEDDPIVQGTIGITINGIDASVETENAWTDVVFDYMTAVSECLAKAGIADPYNELYYLSDQLERLMNEVYASIGADHIQDVKSFTFLVQTDGKSVTGLKFMSAEKF